MGIYDDVMEQLGGTPPETPAAPATPPAAAPTTPGTPPAAPPETPPAAAPAETKGMFDYSDEFQKTYGKA
jgi:hypothetical protein